ncbi:MAG: glycosyltransferase [bacterium]|nr:glycosyltransferase [bacterium]
MPEVSIIVPVKDEAENILTLAGEIEAAMNPHPWRWECVWIDDGSSDDTLKIIKELNECDERHVYLSLERNAGQSAALFAGFQFARGAVFATLDGDGQNDPADLPSLIEKVIGGEADMANGYREKRRDDFIRRIASRIANGFRTTLTGKTVRDVGCSTRAFRRECATGLPCFKGMHRFLPTFALMRGFRLCEGPVNHRPRERGQSKYSINNRLWVGIMDVFGVLWLRVRSFHYRVAETSNDPD